YNLQVEDYHTYFVGCPYWGFSVWAHNAGPEYTGPVTWKNEYDALPDIERNGVSVKQRYLAYLTAKAHACEETKSPAAWWKKAETAWNNTDNGGGFEQQARRAMGAPLGEGSKPTVTGSTRPDISLGEYEVPLYDGSKLKVRGITEVKGVEELKN